MFAPPPPPGCYGAAACASREVSVARAAELVNAVILRLPGIPAKNKWTTVDPAIRKVCRMTLFCGVISGAFAAKVPARRRSAPQPLERDSDAVQGYHERARRRAERAQRFLASDNAAEELLFWVILCDPAMRVHYRLFKTATFFRHCRSSLGLGALGFCDSGAEPRCEGSD